MTKVDTIYGPVQGAVEHDVQVFKGIPFATAERFRPAGPPEPWTELRDASAYGPVCPQGVPGQVRRAMPGMPVREPEPQSEDCLRLNVWSPDTGGSRPVMVYVHGGAFSGGSGSSPMYNGGRLARSGDVVVVTINYRLGILGFLHAPEVGSVNLGLRDQVSALEWVRDNIAAFGGDPSNVTLFGESAGGKSVECLLAMPSSRGLFVRAIAQSTYETDMSQDVYAARTERLAAHVGGVDRLQAMPFEELLTANAELQRASMQQRGAQGSSSLGLGTSAGGPVVDGTFIPAHPIGSTDPVPFVVGTTLDELSGGSMMMGGRQRPEVDEDGLAQRLQGSGVDAATAINAYRQSRGDDMTITKIANAIQVDRSFRQHSIALAEAHAARQPRTYMYLFNGLGGPRGAPHGMELTFVFGMLGGMMVPQDADPQSVRDLSEAMQGAWVAFARGEVPWPAYDAATRRTQMFGSSCEVQDAPLDPERALWTKATVGA